MTTVSRQRAAALACSTSFHITGERTLAATCSIVELRQYTLFGGRRDELIQLFEREFVSSQLESGIELLGTFRDLEDADRFVWLRGFSDMVARQDALERFYGGAAWRKHRDAANATMLDSDNVHLLRPVSGISDINALRGAQPAEVVRIAIHDLRGVEPTLFQDAFERNILPRVKRASGRMIGTFMTETARNEFRLPVRDSDRVYVWITTHADASSEKRFTTALNLDSGWRDDLPPAVHPALMQKPEVLRLSPTASTGMS